MVQLDAMMQSPLYSTTLGGGTEASLHALCGRTIGSGKFAYVVGRQTGPHSCSGELPFKALWGESRA